MTGRSVGSFAAIWLIAALVGLALAQRPAHPESDVTHYKFWARLVTQQGVQASYSGAYPETYSIYPPVTMYGLWAVGSLYRAVVDPTFEREAALASQWLTTAIRLMALAMHLAAGAVLYGLLARTAGPRAALAGAGVYLLNPGALWDHAVWGQPDAWHSLFALLGFWLVGGGRMVGGGAWLGLAAMTKPQAWALLPLAGLWVLRQGGAPGTLRAALGGGAVVLVVLLPFLLGRRLREFLTLPERIAGVMPVASANAHNLWWLVTRGAYPFVIEHERIAGGLPLTYRQAALVLILGVLAFVGWRAWRARDRWELLGLGAYASHAWFCLTTSAHENHPFMLFPFLCLVAWRSRFLAVALGVLVVTFSFNVLGHDSSLAPLLDEALGGWNLRLQLAASGLNLGLLGAWTAWLLRPRSGLNGGRPATPGA